MRLMFSLAGLNLGRDRSWEQLEKAFIQNCQEIQEDAPVDVLAIHAYSFTRAERGSTEFWAQIWSKLLQAKDLSTNAAAYAFFALLTKVPSEADAALYEEILKSLSNVDEGEVIDLECALLLLVQLQASDTQFKEEMMLTVGKKLSRDREFYTPAEIEQTISNLKNSGKGTSEFWDSTKSRLFN